MDDDAIERGLAAWGVPIFVSREGAGERPELAALICACAGSDAPPYRGALVPLTIALLPDVARSAIEEARDSLRGPAAQWIRWSTFAAEYLARMYRSEIESLLGRRAEVPADLFDRRSLPPVELCWGEWGLRTLAEEIEAFRDPGLNWAKAFEASLRALFDVIWEARRERGQTWPNVPHVRSGAGDGR